MSFSADRNNPVNNFEQKTQNRGKQVSMAVFTRLWNDPTLTTSDIGAILGIHQSRVCQRAQTRGLPPRGSLVRIAIRDTDMFREMWDAGVKIEDMARHFKVGRANIKRACKRLGTAPRGKGAGNHSITLEEFWQVRLARQMASTAVHEQVMMLDAGMIERTNTVKAFMRDRRQVVSHG